MIWPDASNILNFGLYIEHNNGFILQANNSIKWMLDNLYVYVESNDLPPS